MRRQYDPTNFLAYCTTVGVLLGFILVQPSDFTDLQTHFALLLDQYDFSLPQMPQIELQLDLPRFEAEWKKVWSNIPEPWKLNRNGLEFTVGEKVASEGLTAKHPVVLVPGIISTVSSQSQTLGTGDHTLLTSYRA